LRAPRQIYGRPQRLPVNEEHPLQPVDVNGINKIAGEYYHLLYDNVYDLNACALRLTNTYGPRMRVKDARQTFLGIWIRLLVEGKPFEVWEGDQLRDFTYVDDAAEAFLLAASHVTSRGSVFNLGGEPVVMLKQLADLLVEIYGRGEYVVRSYPADRKRIDIGDYYSDFSKIKAKLGWEPKRAAPSLFTASISITTWGKDRPVGRRMTVPPADPRSNYLARAAEIDAAIRRVLESGSYILGREVELFEQEFAGYLGEGVHAVGVANGTDAIMLALKALGVGPGHVVFTVSLTAVATVAAVEAAGAIPFPVDLRPESYTMDPEKLSEAIRFVAEHERLVKGRPAAVLPVHLYGHPADMRAINDLARSHGLYAIEDCAQAHGAVLEGTKAGCWADIATPSASIPPRTWEPWETVGLWSPVIPNSRKNSAC